jgi:hypothetical protein
LELGPMASSSVRQISGFTSRVSFDSASQAHPGENTDGNNRF